MQYTIIRISIKENYIWADNIELYAVFIKNLNLYHIGTSSRSALRNTFYCNSMYTDPVMNYYVEDYISKIYVDFPEAVRDSLLNDFHEKVSKSYNTESLVIKDIKNIDSIYETRLTINKIIMEYYIDPFIDNSFHRLISECPDDYIYKLARIIEILPLKEEQEFIWEKIFSTK